MASKTECTAFLLAVVCAACTGHLRQTGPDVSPDGGDGLPDAGPGGRDAFVAPPQRTIPGANVELFTYVAQHDGGDRRWGDALTDVVRHLPADTVAAHRDADFVVFGHEATHGVHQHLRDNFDTTGRGAAAFYLLEDRAATVVPPPIAKSDMAGFVPESLRGPLYDQYVLGSVEHETNPLFLWDEWVAHTNGAAVALDRVQAGLWARGDDATGVLVGQLEATVIALATAMAVESIDPVYLREYRQFRELLAFAAERAMGIHSAASATTELASAEADGYLGSFRQSPEAADLRDFIARTYGTDWSTEVFGFEW